MMKCDFCSHPKVEWRYPAESFIGYVFGNVAGESVGDWAACETCHQLIASGDRSALTERCIATLIDAQPALAELRSELAAEMKILHTGFFDRRRGEAVPVPPDGAHRTGCRENMPIGRL